MSQYAKDNGSNIDPFSKPTISEKLKRTKNYLRFSPKYIFLHPGSIILGREKAIWGGGGIKELTGQSKILKSKLKY